MEVQSASAIARAWRIQEPGELTGTKDAERAVAGTGESASLVTAETLVCEALHW